MDTYCHARDLGRKISKRRNHVDKQRNVHTRQKQKKETAQWCVCQPCSAWQRSSHVGYWGRWLNTEMKKKNLKARQIIGFGSACVLGNAAMFAQLEHVPMVISAGSRVWHCRAHLQYTEESLDASLSLHKAHIRVHWQITISATGRQSTVGQTDLALLLFWIHYETKKLTIFGFCHVIKPHLLGTK